MCPKNPARIIPTKNLADRKKQRRVDEGGGCFGARLESDPLPWTDDPPPSFETSVEPVSNTYCAPSKSERKCFCATIEAFPVDMLSTQAGGSINLQQILAPTPRLALVSKTQVALHSVNDSHAATLLPVQADDSSLALNGRRSEKAFQPCINRRPVNAFRLGLPDLHKARKVPQPGP